MNATATIIEDERLSLRAACSRQVRVEVAGRDAFQAALLNISATGFRAMISGQVNVGAVVTIQYSLGRKAAAIVVWQTGAVIGCHFIAPLDSTAVSAIVSGLASSC